MKPFNLKLNILGLLLTTAALPVVASGPAPDLTAKEKILFSITRAAMGMMVGHSDAKGCTDAAGSYSFTATADSVSGSGILDNRSITAEISQSDAFSTYVTVSTSGAGQVSNTDIQEFTSTYHFSDRGEMMDAKGVFQIRVNSLGEVFEAFDNVMAVDFYWGPVYSSKTSNGVLDYGLIVNTQRSGPRTKWRKNSQYLRQNDTASPPVVEGRMSVTIVQIAPDNAPLCKISLRKADISDNGNTLELNDTIKVSSLVF